MKTYTKQLKELQERSDFQKKDLTTIIPRGIFFDYRNHNPILFGKDAVKFMRQHYGKIVPLIFSHNGYTSLKFECWKLNSARVENPRLITQHIIFQLESGDSLVWPPKYSDPYKKIYPLLGVQSV